MSGVWTRRHHWITAGLVLFCGVMTFFLARSEYFPESSLLNRLPPRYVFEKVLRNENVSSMKIEWKEEAVGALTFRVTPGERTVVRSSVQGTIPILGQKPKARLDMVCALRTGRDVESFRIQGRWQEMDFLVAAEAPIEKIEIEVRGRGMNVKREWAVRDFLKLDGAGRMSAIPELPSGAFLARAREWSGAVGRWRTSASSARISRRGDWMDAYLLSVRADENTWARIWISPTGELLKMESSFGLSAINEDFFEGLPSAEAKPVKRQKSSRKRETKFLPSSPLFTLHCSSSPLGAMGCL